MLFSQISAPVSEVTAVGNPVMECAYGLFSSPYTLSKCNGCLTSTCLVFKRCPRHWCQTSYWVISHQCLPCDRMGSSRDTQHCQKTTTVSQKSPCSELFDMQVSCITLFMLQFYLQSMQDGIFGEGLCSLQLNETMYTFISIKHACKHMLVFMSPADEIIAASRHGERYWCGSYRKGIFNTVLLVRALVRSQSFYKEGARWILKDGHCCRRDWCSLGVTDSGPIWALKLVI